MVENGSAQPNETNTNSSYHAVHMQYLYYFADSAGSSSLNLNSGL